MAIKFTTTQEEFAQFVKLLVYGRSGIGKTDMIKTAISPLIISSEHRLLTLKKHKIPVILIENHEDLEKAYTFVTTNPKAKKYKTICLDSLTDIGESILAYFKKNPVDGNTHPQAAYGMLADTLLPLIKKFRDIPDKHVYMIAKAKLSEDEYSGVSTWSPAMPGKALGYQLPYLFDFVLPMRMGETNQGKKYRFLQTQEDIQWLAKECSGELKPIERPDLTKLFNKILGGKNEKAENPKTETAEKGGNEQTENQVQEKESEQEKVLTTSSHDGEFDNFNENVEE